jgi:hypothetical protein
MNKDNVIGLKKPESIIVANHRLLPGSLEVFGSGIGSGRHGQYRANSAFILSACIFDRFYSESIQNIWKRSAFFS